MHLFRLLRGDCLQDDIRRVTRELEKSGGEKADLTSKIEEITLYNDNSERELRNLIKTKQVCCCACYVIMGLFMICVFMCCVTIVLI